MRILFFDGQELSYQQDKSTHLIKIALSIAIAIAMADFYLESRIHFYPVSYYDYLWVAITTLIIKLYPLKKYECDLVCSAISLSPIIVFIFHYARANFQFRNSWGFYNPNGLGIYCAICLPLIICLLISQFCSVDLEITNNHKIINQILSLLGIISLFFCLTMLISSGSRSSLYTSIILIVSILFLHFKTLLKKSIKDDFNCLPIKAIFFYSFAFLGLASILYKLIFAKFVFITRFINITNSTNLYRTYIYQCYWKLGLEKPWSGWGIDKTSALCEQQLKARYGGVNHGHNFILQLFADGGAIVTLLCIATIFYFILIPVMKFLVSYNSLSNSTLYLGISFSSLSILTVSLFQSSFYHYPLFPLWLGLFSGFLGGLQLKGVVN
ncbi:O-antigen ligase family protein [Waterburya agarophytonicola K14]|uniref:O-antigen ligase family protein n=1 Tax=Waterburya agarophytonicola KI4 TaxID=2874699 RepID=A0A964BU62_9CYAN|nr:O-antigen ligase family protein [Waterburya agarophytonicola]MCC0179869.1 O-antigen ligase family protein [Waterburya agarophytonicola KI4]